MQRVKLSLACLLCVSWVTSVSAQVELENDSGIATLQDFSGGVSLGSGAFFNIQHLSGGGVGYTNGYTNLGAFLPYWVNDDVMVAPNGRIFFTNNNNVGGSIGGVVRRYSESYDRIFGFNVYGDFEQTFEGYNYNQLGFGFESLGQYFDMRSNVYLPDTNSGNFVKAVSLGNTPYFAGNGINFVGVGQFQEALRGADFEVGAPITQATPWLRAYAGVYAYSATGSDPIGARGRLEANVSDDLTIGVNVTEDQVFGTNVNAVVDFRFSGFKPTRYFPQWTTRDRMLANVQRNGRISTNLFNRNVPVAAINPGTGNPYFVVWVDNSNPAPGNGSYENPYHDFQPSQPYPGADLILVRRGNSDVVPLNGPVQLFDNQRLLGEGREHSFAANAQFEQLALSGVFKMPGFVNSGLYPTITAPGDNIILANNNEVSAFNLINAGGAAITNIPATGSRDFNLNYLNIANNQRGIFLQNASGIGVINQVNALDNLLGGIQIVNSAPLDLIIQDTTSNGTAPGTQAVGIELAASNAPLKVTLNNVSTIGNSGGTRIDSINSDVIAIFNTVNASQNFGPGFQAFIDGGSFAMAANSLNASGNTQDNVYIQLTNAANMDLIFRNVDASGSIGGNGIVVTNTGGTGTAFFDVVNAGGNAQTGLTFAGDAGAFIQGKATGNTLLNNNGQNGLLVLANNNSIVTFTDDLNISGNGGNGVMFVATGNSLIDLNLNNLNVDNNGNSAIFGVNLDSTVFATFNNVTGRNSGADGLFLFSSNGANFLRVNNGNFSNSGQAVANSAGMNVFAVNASLVQLDVSGNSQLNNSGVTPVTQADGLRIYSNFGSLVNANLDGADLTGNLDNAVDATVEANGRAVVNLVNSDASFSGFDGIRLTGLTGGQLRLIADTSPINASGANGIDAFVRSDADVAVDIRNGSTILFSGQNGLKVDAADAGTTFVAQINDSDLSESGFAGGGLNTQDAVHVRADNAAQVDINLVNTPTTNFFFNSQQRSLSAVVSTGAVFNYNNTNGDMSLNQLNAMAVSVANPGSVANLNIVGTPMNNSGETGFIWNVSDSGVLNATITNSSLDSSGANGVQGSGIFGVATTGGMANLNLTNTPVTNALDDAVFVVATDLGTTVNAVFDASPLDNAGQSALDLTFLNGAAGIFTLRNGSTGNNAGLDALRLVADGVAGGVNTSLTVNAFDSSLNDSGLNGINALVSLNANMVLNVVNTPVTNTVGTAPQLRGMLFSVLSGGNLQANFFNSNLSNHSLEGINGTVDGFDIADSRAAIRLNNTPVNGNVLNGMLFNVTNRGDLVVIADGGTSVSNNGATGIQTNVDGALSTATLVLDTVAVDGNGALVGGDGLNVVATNAAAFSILATDSSFSNNANGGIDLLTTTAAGGFARFNNATVNNNQEEGLRSEANSASTLRTIFVGGSLSDNGLIGGTNNVTVISTQSSIVESYFENITADNATLNGFSFDVNQGSILVGQMRNGVTSNNNANGNGVRFVARDAFTQGILYMEGDNQFNNNGTAVVGTNVSPQAGAGVFFDANGVSVAGIRVSGSANANGNNANGFSDVDGDGDSDDDGVYVNIRNTGLAAAAFAGGGTSTISNNIGDGIDVQFSNVGNIGTIVQPSLVTPPGVTIGSGNNAISIDQLIVDANPGTGIKIVANNSNMTGNISINNSSAAGSGGDGLLIGLTNIAGQPSILVNGSGFTNSGANGINLNLNNAGINALSLTNNTAGAALPPGTIDFSFTNLIWTTILDNNSTPGLDIARVSLNIAPAGQGWRPDLNPFSPGRFQPQGGSDVTVGLTAVNGIGITPGTDPLQDAAMAVLPNGGVTPGSQVITLDFNDFNPGETWTYELAHTLIGNNTLQSGTTLVGSTGTVTLADGRSASGVFGNFGLNIVQALPQLVPGISNNALDGVRISAVNSNIESVFVDNNTINNNGTAGGVGNGNGINFATVTNSSIADPAGGMNRFNVSNNTITGNDGDGFRLVNPTTGAQTAFDMTFDANTISTNTGTGINLVMQTGQQNLGSVPQIPGQNVDFLNNTINGNLSGPGINLALADNRNFSGNFNGNTINQNGAEGVNFAPGLNGQIVANFTNNTINGNTSHGIDIPLAQGGRFTSQNFFGNTIGTAASRNGGMGVNLVVPNNAQFNWQLGNTAAPANSIGGNTDAGVGIQMSGNATGTLAVANSSFSNTVAGGANLFGGSGLAISQTDTTLLNNVTIGDVATNNTSFNSNAGDGLRWRVAANAQLSNPIIRNVTANANTGDGINMLRVGNGVVNNVTINNSIFTSNSDGVDIGAQFAMLDDEYTITNNTFNLNNANGIRMNAQADARINTVLANNTITRSGQDGINISTVAISPGDVAEVFSGLGTWTNNVIDLNGRLNGNLGAGIEISGFHTITLGTAAAGNFIRSNGGDGIEINAPGTLIVNSAVITDNVTAGTGNGLAGIDLNSSGGNTLIVIASRISNNNGDGLELDNPGLNTVVSLIDNAIQFNTRDGVEFMDLFDGTLFINGSAPGSSVISDNGFRGVDIASAGSNAGTTVAINNTSILRNGQEGLYVVNSSDSNQETAAFRDNLASAAMAATGGIGSSSFLTMSVTNNSINQNGQVPGTFGGSGLVLRVGTSRGGDNFNVAGGFANAANGGVNAVVTGNTLTGNFGADVIAQSFVSTVNPGTTAGSWTDQNEAPRNGANDTFAPAGYQSDPLARLDLVFQNNTGDELDVTRVGAAYTNDEPIFKSRTQNQDNATDGGPDDDGPFGTGTRSRNAQRLAARNVDTFFGAGAGTRLNPDLTIGASNAFLFSGLGQSTFRANQSGNTFINTAPGGGFIFDDFTADFTGNNAIYDSFFEARGNGGGGFGGGSTGPFGIDTMPWGWATLP